MQHYFLIMKLKNEEILRVCQGDILRNVEYIEKAEEIDGIITISKIVFPYIVVLTQDCDLLQDYNNREYSEKHNQDKFLMSVIVAPVYNIEHVYSGTHLSELGLTMRTINRKSTKTENQILRQNKNPRYHFLQLQGENQMVDSVIDFKHYFSVNVSTIKEHKRDHYIGMIPQLYRELLSQRFANFLCRIGLPDES